MNQIISTSASFMITYFAEPQSSVDKILKVHHKIYDLLSSISMANYSLAIEKVLVILVAFSAETFPEKDRLIFRKKQNKIEIRINIDYEKLKSATEAETLQLIAEAYLAAISRFLSKRKDFDAKNFYIDVENLFRENHFLA
jgi:hypothetical protein